MTSLALAINHETQSGSAFTILACKILFCTFLFFCPPFLDVFAIKGRNWKYIHICVNECRGLIFSFLVLPTEVKNNCQAWRGYIWSESG